MNIAMSVNIVLWIINIKICVFIEQLIISFMFMLYRPYCLKPVVYDNV